MNVITPLTIRTSELTSSTVAYPDAGETAWSSAAVAYAVGSYGAKSVNSDHRQEISLASAAVGAAAGYNLDKTRICRKYKGETVTVIDNNGKVISTTFVPAE